MRVLLSDGSGLTARQVATQLSVAGHVVEVLTADRLALTALGTTPAVQRPARAGVATHQLLLAVLRAAQRDGARRAVLREMAMAWRQRESYENSAEELTPLRHDLRTAFPVVTATVATLGRPALWSAFSSGAVTSYALTPAGWEEILAGPPTHLRLGGDAGSVPPTADAR